MKFFKKQGVAWVIAIVMIAAAIVIGLGKAKLQPSTPTPGNPAALDTSLSTGAYQQWVGDFAGALSDKEIEYAALPIPKYDTNQKNYITTMNHNFSVFGILNQLGESDISCAAAVLEALASEAYRTVSPAIFEKAFRLRYSANSDISQMYQYVRDGLKFDMGRLYRLNFTSNIPDTLFRNAVRANSGWATVISNKGKWNRTLTEISNSLDKLS